MLLVYSARERQADKQQLVSVEESTCEKLTPGVTKVVYKVDAHISKVPERVDVISSSSERVSPEHVTIY